MSMQTGLQKMSSPTLAAWAGAAVCLAGVEANAVSGPVSASNSGRKTFTVSTGDNSETFKLFDSNASMEFHHSGGFNILMGQSKFGSPKCSVYFPGTHLRMSAAGVSVPLGTQTAVNAYLAPNISNKFAGIRFKIGGNDKFGWIEFISISADKNVVVLGDWGYDPTGGNIRTLSDSVTLRQLEMNPQGTMLHWSNRDESGVVRYEVQQKVAAGWKAVDAQAPGAGRYSCKALPGDYRLLIEKVDGTSEYSSFSDTLGAADPR